METSAGEGAADRTMMHCPECDAEYRPGFTECADCRVPLAEGSPPEEPEPERARFDPDDVPRLVAVYSTNRIHADVVRSLLEGSGIPTILSKEGYTSAYPLTVGAIGGGIVLVREQDQERARDVIAMAVGGELDPQPDSEEAPWPRLAWWGLGLVILMLLVVIAVGAP